MGNPSASGRYIVSQPSTVPPSFVYDTLVKAFPEHAWGKPTEEGVQMPLVNNSKIISLIGGLHSLEDTIVDMARSMISAKLAIPTPANSSSTLSICSDQ